MNHLGSLVLADVLWSPFQIWVPSLELAGFRKKWCCFSSCCFCSSYYSGISIFLGCAYPAVVAPFCEQVSFMV